MNIKTRDELEDLFLKIARGSNRSIAASSWDDRLFTDASFELKAVLAEWGARIASAGEIPDFTIENIESILADPPAKKSGPERISYADQYMPCINKLAEDYAPGKSGPDVFEGIRIATWMIIEPKTAALLLKLRKLGADVAIACGAEATDQDIVDSLKEAGIKVYADSFATRGDDHAYALRLLDELKPDILLDDGAALSRLIYNERPELIKKLIGICEETTSGVKALEAMQADGTLDVPAIAVNDAAVKTLFDNAHGTGETVLMTLLTLTGSIEGKELLVCGYGPVGKGLAKRCRAAGANVCISEIDPVAALQALHDGYPVKKAIGAVGTTDIILSASGVSHTLTPEILKEAKDGAIVATAGGTWQEIAIEECLKIPGAEWDDSDKDLCLLTIGNRKLTVLSRGYGINYTSGDGNSIETMDLSFAAQLSALHWLIQNKNSLSPGVHRLPKEIPAQIATIKLEAMSAGIDSPEPKADWKISKLNG